MKKSDSIQRNVILTAILAAVMLCGTVASAKPSTPAWAYTDEKAPLSPRAFYDINVTDGTTLKNFLWVIDETYNLLIDKGVPPCQIKFVVSLRGASVTMVTNDYETGGVGDEVRALLSSLMSKGVRIEACDISLDWMGVDAADLVDGIAVIDNAFAAAIFYQRRGFATVPITELP